MPSFKDVSCQRARSSSTNSCAVVVAAVILGALIMGGCGQHPREASAHVVEFAGLPSPATTLAADPSASDVRSMVEIALSESLATQAGSVQRHTSAGMAGISVLYVTDLSWSGDSGHLAKKFVVDDKYLFDPNVRELVETTNRDLQPENRDLHGSDLDGMLDTARATMSDLLDDVELKPLGLGWWEGTVGGEIDLQTLQVMISDGKLLKISRSVDVLATTARDTWEFTS